MLDVAPTLRIRPTGLSLSADTVALAPTLRVERSSLAVRQREPLRLMAPLRVDAPRLAAAPVMDGSAPEVRVNPYIEFSARFTPQGGIEFTYRDRDTSRFRTALQFLLWAVLTAAVAAWLRQTALYSDIQWELIIAAAIGFYFLCFRPRDIARTLEIRPDAMILDRADVFWLDRMELGWPEFMPDEEGNLVLQGVYGTRMVTYLTVRHFDEHDRSPEVLQGRVRAAMQQLWNPAI